jgi:hypothetical protein
MLDQTALYHSLEQPLVPLPELPLVPLPEQELPIE